MMNLQAMAGASKGLFGICVTVAAMEQLAGKGGASRVFRALCALVAALCALRTIAYFI